MIPKGGFSADGRRIGPSAKPSPPCRSSCYTSSFPTSDAEDPLPAPLHRVQL